MDNRNKKVQFPSGNLTNVYVKNGYETTSYRGITHYGFHCSHELGKSLLSAIILKNGRFDKEELLYIRKKLDYTQQEIANIIGTTEQTYMQWERGDRHISKAEDTLLRVFVSQKLKKQLTKEGQGLTVEIASRLNEKLCFVEYIGEYSNNKWVIETKEIVSLAIQNIIKNAISKYDQPHLEDSLLMVPNYSAMTPEESLMVPPYFSHSNALNEYQKDEFHVIH